MPLKNIFLVLLSVLLQVGAFPIAGPMPSWRGVLGWFALVPFLLALLLRRQDGVQLTLAQTAVLGYGCGFLFYLLNCSWIYQTMYLYGGLPKPVALLILILFSAYLGLYHGLFGWLIGLSHQATGVAELSLVFAPFAWVAVELARARVTGFPWDLLGYSQIDNFLLLRLAPLAGVMAISFVLAAVSAGCAWGVLVAGLKVRASVLGSTLVCIAAVVFWGSQDLWHLQKGKETAVLLQENLSVGVTAHASNPPSLREELQQFAALSRSPQHLAGSSQGPTIVIWPEAPSHLLANDTAFKQALGQLAVEVKAPLVVGSIGVDQNSAVPRGYLEFDSAALFTKSGNFEGRYDKIHLVPWGEYVPLKQFFAFAQKLTEGVGDMDRGTRRTVFRTDGRAYGVFICYESIFGDEVRQFVGNGAEVLINISDDGWYGDTGAPWQHLNMARMRAVENHRWLLRDTNTGETTVIDPEGRYTETERHVRTAYALPFSFSSEMTFYTRYGDWFAYLCSGLTVLALSFGLLRRRTEKWPACTKMKLC